VSGIAAITLFVDDLPAAKAFYETAFEQPLVFEDGNSAVFEFDNMVVNLLATPAADSLIAPAEVGERDAGARFQLTIRVDDADATCAQLRARGVTLLNGPVDRAWGLRTAAFEDPAGHIWEVASELPRGQAGSG
jgi:catechol 2,3-dioxygenase-like lactoylglutathione lyase family enzyme